jgi:hypothetical protein
MGVSPSKDSDREWLSLPNSLLLNEQFIVTETRRVARNRVRVLSSECASLLQITEILSESPSHLTRLSHFPAIGASPAHESNSAMAQRRVQILERLHSVLLAERMHTASHTGEVLDVIPTFGTNDGEITKSSDSMFSTNALGYPVSGQGSSASSVVAASSIRMSLVLMRRYHHTDPSLFCEMCRSMVELLINLPPASLHNIAPPNHDVSQNRDVLSFGGGFGSGVHSQEPDFDARTLRAAVECIRSFAMEVIHRATDPKDTGTDKAEWSCAVALLLALALAEGSLCVKK